MKPKLQEYMNDSRIPIFIRKRNETIYFQMQIEVAREDGLCAGTYLEFEKLTNPEDVSEIGSVTKTMLSRFQKISDLTLSEFHDITGMEMEAYENSSLENIIKYMGINTEKELNESFDMCSVNYDIKSNKYFFSLSWVYQEGKKKWYDGSDSTGKKDILTFAEPLEFDDNVAPEHLGAMILEAFERSRKMAAAMSSGVCPPKEIDLFEGTTILVTPPKDKHFADFNDANVGEIYQDYPYIAREGADSSADFMLTMAPELYKDLSCDNIHNAWIDTFGEADEINVSKTTYGIYRYRAEMKNKKMYRIAYFKELKDGTVLECCMEIADPAKKKKLSEKLPILFEDFAYNCKIK